MFFLPLNRGWHYLLRKKSQTGPPPENEKGLRILKIENTHTHTPRKQKTTKYWKNKEQKNKTYKQKKIFWDSCLAPHPSPKSLKILLFLFVFVFCFLFFFQGFFVFWVRAPRQKSLEIRTCSSFVSSVWNKIGFTFATRFTAYSQPVQSNRFCHFCKSFWSFCKQLQPLQSPTCKKRKNSKIWAVWRFTFS